jgi:hypothetical protein
MLGPISGANLSSKLNSNAEPRVAEVLGGIPEEIAPNGEGGMRPWRHLCNLASEGDEEEKM